jgi:hypothetical protein
MFGWTRKPPRNPFESRTELWRQVGLGAEIDRARAQRARGSAFVLVALIALVLILFSRRRDFFPGLGTEVRIATVVLLVVFGWTLARQLAAGFAPALLRRPCSQGWCCSARDPFAWESEFAWSEGLSPAASRGSSAPSASSTPLS